ncbi:AraC family transcriptional regulator [Algoriphagus aquimarinus]|uniref:helix-turn-helix domain-containing protein n=1 Tax=Algoriphagus aquimarinus TaxID=237018 RepID=UPI0030D957A4|tara:strand:- start:141557 stop:142120 length:564 start_codon:yes stop_codon:yes gene_type:complete
MPLIYIKNMVCPRCIVAVKDALDQEKIGFTSVELGKVNLKEYLSVNQKKNLVDILATKGFELLENHSASLISQIKALIVSQIHHSDKLIHVNFSTFLSQEIGQEYTSMSRLFSQVEGITIEKYITQQKTEKVKELLIYDELSLSEIADKLNYSSMAYLSSQFKKETGMTPTEFKKQAKPHRKGLDEI